MMSIVRPASPIFAIQSSAAFCATCGIIAIVRNKFVHNKPVLPATVHAWLGTAVMLAVFLQGVVGQLKFLKKLKSKGLQGKKTAQCRHGAVLPETKEPVKKMTRFDSTMPLRNTAAQEAAPSFRGRRCFVRRRSGSCQDSWTNVPLVTKQGAVDVSLD